MLAPNKQSLLLLRSQQTLIQNGYKLLKEKRSGLINSFLTFANQGKKLENELNLKLEKILNFYLAGLTFTDLLKLKKVLVKQPILKLEIQKKRISGVRVSDLKLQIKPIKRTNLKISLQQALNEFNLLFPDLIRLEQIKLTCQQIAMEIKKTNRQISNIEKKIEDTDSQIKQILFVLNEISNLEKATLIQIFK